MDKVVEDFHKKYYEVREQTWRNTHWLGVPVYKCALDLWIYQELVWEIRPELIVECGTAAGGSGLYFANLLDLVGGGQVITIDVKHPPRRLLTHPRLTFIRGSSVEEAVIREVRNMAAQSERTMVMLDSDHSKDHVAQEIRFYAPLVSIRSYLIVEDTNINGNPVQSNLGPGSEGGGRGVPREHR